jgi:hypothetical protein
MDFEQRLRASLVAPNPGAVFTARVMARVGRGSVLRRKGFIVIGTVLAVGAAAAMLTWRMPAEQPPRIEATAVSTARDPVSIPDRVVEMPVAQPPKQPASAPQPAHEPPPSAITTPVPAETPSASPPTFTAAQATPPSSGSSIQPAPREQAAPALPKLLPPTPLPRTLDNEDARRSEENTGAAVLAARPSLESEFSEDTVLTVFMTEDGKIDRSQVMGNPAQLIWGDMAFPVDFSTAPTGMVPELLAKRFEPLGLRPEQLGQMGLAVIDNKNKPGTGNNWVLYAWPRRAGEPIGGFMPIYGQTWRSSFTHADVTAVVERQLPGALKSRGGSGGRVWLLLSPQGEVVGSGYIPATAHRWARTAFVQANPGRRIGLVVGVTDQVILGWLEPAPSPR